MGKLISTLALFATLTACNLYFQEPGSGSGPSVGTSQPPRGGPVPDAGYGCSSNADCAAGCYCSSGECVEGGFCMTDGDCGSGYTCDTGRSSCEPGCGSITDEADCIANSACQATYTGNECTDSQGKACTTGDTNCTCASFTFAGCE